MKNIILCTFFVAMCSLMEVTGSTWRVKGRCIGITDEAPRMISAVACADVAVMCPPGQHMDYTEEDLSKPYPQCCRVAICKDD